MKENKFSTKPHVLATVLVFVMTVLIAGLFSVYLVPINNDFTESGPNTVFTVEETQTTIDDENIMQISFGHNVGDSIPTSELRVTVNSRQAVALSSTQETEIVITESPNITGVFSGSDSFNVIGYRDTEDTDTETNTTLTSADITVLQPGDVIRITWVDESEEDTQVLREYVVPSSDENS